ncbi:hypothetical protein [Thalassovita taeanensis]|uniref:Uncharacterized protein n=1 Tax=Thalassovita taeanensis TaxID=657014 RepID=A0A1H9JUV0_9RHOB|nr:hypothetical protein [Thalassovita taeanensis]SEQ90543.1 hypothetical protein SAMN04488092_11638 [Thalassovita taeanensis]
MKSSDKLPKLRTSNLHYRLTVGMLFFNDVEVVFVLRAVFPKKVSATLQRAVVRSCALFGVTAAVAGYFDAFNRTAIIAVNINVIGSRSNFCHDLPRCFADYAAQPPGRASEVFTNA